MIKSFQILFLFLISILLLTCKSDSKLESNTEGNYGYERAHNPWVFRSVLDKKARVITLALNDELWAAYSTQDCSIYKVWKGFVNFDGAVYNTVHGPQPVSFGDGYFVNEFSSPWLSISNGKETPISANYKGHRIEKGQVVLMYELLLTDGSKVMVYEKPEYIERENGLSGFERTFELEGLKEGISIALKTNISSISGSSELGSKQTNFKADGELKYNEIVERNKKDLSAIDLKAILILNSKKPTTLSCTFVKIPMIENSNRLEDEKELDKPLGYKLIARNDCKSCHNTFRKTIGPSYIDVARKYDNTEANVAMLSQKVKYGGSGVWGSTMMNAHPNVDDLDIKAMVQYVMTLDAEEEKLKEASPKKQKLEFTAAAEIDDKELLPGLRMKFVRISESIKGVDDINFDKRIEYEGFIPNLEIFDADLTWAGDWFGIQMEGFINVPKDNNYVFTLSSDDGSRFYLDNKMIIDNDGFHGMETRDGEMALKQGLHPFRIDYFQGSGGKAVSLKWRSFDEPLLTSIPASAIMHHKKDQAVSENAKTPPLANTNKIAGDKLPLAGVHPAFNLSQARPATFLPKVGGMDFMPNGKLLVSTWDAGGEVHSITNAQGDDPGEMEVKTIARGLAEPLGLKVVDGNIYVLQKQELTQLIDLDGDELIDEYKTICNAWDVSANFHEFAFGLEEKDGWLYGNLAIGIQPGGASAKDQPKHRGNTFRIEIASGKIEFIGSGLRTPNGVGRGVDGELFVSDNQGDWLPASKIMHVKKGAWHGSRAVDFEGTEGLEMLQPVVWLPQDEIGNSPSQISPLNVGPYKGQMVHGEVTHGGLKRVFAEKINGNYQGAVFRFTQGLEAGVNRMCWGPDGALYVGGIGSSGNWQHSGRLWYGLQKLKYNSKPVFEMLAVRAKSNGVEIEFTEPLREGEGEAKSLYNVKQWYYKPTAEYGGPKINEKNLNIRSVNVLEGRKKVFLELDGMKEKHVLYLLMNEHLISSEGNGLYSTEAWYTLNSIPQNDPGFKTAEKSIRLANTLTEKQKAAGWKLLFDGKSTNGWSNYRKDNIGASWQVQNGALTLASSKKENGDWQIKDGGDIVTENVYENFEFELDWKIQACGNSGIMYLVEESDKFDYPWMTGPEMQILDNTCHPDAKITKHRAGDLYDIMECEQIAVKPAGEWNKARILVKNGMVEHWLNGVKLLETEFWTDEWKEKLSASKWKDFPDFGTKKKGKIALQDHGDRVWFRNIRIREL